MRVALVILLELLSSPSLAEKADEAWMSPRYAVGDQVSAETKLVSRIAGFDLPIPEDDEGYMRGDETIYCVHRETMEILKVIPIGSVLMH